jgi:hypothetical protein
MLELPPTLAYFGSLQGARKVLQHQMLPLFQADQLNDPFLPNQYSELQFDCQELYERTVKYMTSSIFGKSPPRGNPNHPLQRAIRRWRGENRFSDEAEIRDALVSLLPAMVEQQFNEAQQIHREWLSYVGNKQILPLFADSNNPELWLVEADRYAGVVIKFKCEEDSIFEQCVPVHYDKHPAKTVKITDCVEYMVGELNEIEVDYLKILTTQNYQFRQQKEWRLIVEQAVMADRHINVSKDLIQSIYIGAAVDTFQTEKLAIQAHQLNPKINVYKANCSDLSYQFNYQKLAE